MASSVTPFRNRDNFAKYMLLHYEPGANVLLKVFSWLYNGPSPFSSQHLVSLASDRANGFNNEQKAVIGRFHSGDMSLHQFDFSLLYLIIKNCCNVASRTDSVWGKKCPPDRTQELEHLLCMLKQGRNDIAHPSDALKNLTDSQVQTKADEIYELLSAVIEKAGARANVDADEVDLMLTSVKDNIVKICEIENHDTKIKPYIHQLIREDLILSYESSISNSLNNEFKGYSRPTLIVHKDHSDEEQESSKILNNFEGKNIIMLQGSAGEGKSALVLSLFYSWLSGSEDFENLSSFDAIFMIKCENINTRSISEFLESELPTATLSFSNTSSLRRQLKASKILWILDGYDQSTAEAKGFLKEILGILSPTQKLLITLRPNYREILDIIIPMKETLKVDLGVLNDESIKEMFRALTDNDSMANRLMQFYETIIKLSTDTFRNPLTVRLYIDQQLRSPDSLYKYSLTQLYRADVTYKMVSLAQRMASKTALTENELKDKIKNWFDFLCFQSFYLLCNSTYGAVSKIVEKKLIHQAGLHYLIASDCISTFFTSSKTKSDEHTYMHLTQQYYLAALYLKQAMMDETAHQRELTEAKDTAFNDYDNRMRFLVHYREVILWLIWNEVEVASSSFNVDMIMKALAFSEYEWSLRFVAYFIQASNNNMEFIMRVGQKVSEPCWYIFDDEVTLFAASKLIEIIQPESIYLIFSKLKTVSFHKLILELLTLIQRNYGNIQLVLRFTEHEKIGSAETSDAYLPAKPKERGKKVNLENFNRVDMNLSIFTGALNDCSWLRYRWNILRVLHLRITNETGLRTFIQIVKQASKLEIARVTVDFHVTGTVDIFSTFPKHHRPICHLIFPHMTESNYKIYYEMVKTMASGVHFYNNFLTVKKFKKLSLSKKNFTDAAAKILIESLFIRWVKSIKITHNLLDEYSQVGNQSSSLRISDIIDE